MKYIAPKALGVTMIEAGRLPGELWAFQKWTTLDIKWRMGTARYIVVLTTAKGCFVRKILSEDRLDCRRMKIEDLAPESIHVVTRAVTA